MAQPLGEHIVIPLSKTEVERLGFPVDEDNEDRVYGVILSAWDMKRGFARWSEMEGKPNPMVHEQTADIVTHLNRKHSEVVEELREERKAKNDEISKHAKSITAYQAEIEKWKGNNFTRSKQIEELQQALKEEQTKVSQAEASMKATETIVNGKEDELEQKDAIIDAKQKTINRFQERYQSVDRPLTWIQRAAAKLFKI